jgi:hypothetical protein
MDDAEFTYLVIIAVGVLAVLVPYPMQILYALWAISTWYFIEDDLLEQ